MGRAYSLVVLLVVICGSQGWLQDNATEEKWFILRSGEDLEGCGLSPDKACRTLAHILQTQVLSKNPGDITLGNLQIITDKSININQHILDGLQVVSSVELVIYEESSEVPLVTFENVNLSRKNTMSICRRSYYTCLEDRKWHISGLDVNILNSDMEYVNIFARVNHQHVTNRVFRNTKVTIHNSSFGSLDLKSETVVNITDCYLNGRGIRSPLITAEGASVTITGSEFHNFKSMNGPTILHGKHGTKVSVENSSFHNNQALYGIVYLHENCSIYMTSVQVYLFRSCQCGLSAFIFWKNVICVIENSLFQENYAYLGSAMVALNNSAITSVNNTFIENQGLQGGALGIMGCSSLEVSNNIFLRNNAQADDMSPDDFEIPESCDLTLFSVISKDIFKNPNLVRIICIGGAIVAKRESNITLNSSYFIGNGAEIGGAIYVEQNISAIVINSVFTKNSAHVGGGFFAHHQVALTIGQSSFLQNHAGVSGGAVVLKDNSTTTIFYSNFTNNLAEWEGGAILGKDSEIHSANNSFHKNYAEEYGGVLVSVNSKTWVFYSVFSDNQAKYGGAFAILENSKFYMRSSNLTNNEALDGGVFYFSAEVIGTITGCSFIKNVAKYGGVFWGESQVEIYIAKSNFQTNVGKLYGAAVICFNETGFQFYHNFFKTGSSNSKDGTILSPNYSIIIETCNFYYALKESFQFLDDLLFNTDDECYFIGNGAGNLSLC